MKAWCVTSDCAENSEIVYADTRGQAIAKSDLSEEERYIDIRAHRLPKIDGMECEGGRKRDYWHDDAIRLILVREYDWACIEPDWRECEECIAKSFCHWHEDEES